MAGPERQISESELSVLKLLWEAGQGSVREIQEKLHEQGLSWAYTTVQTLLNRLREKGYADSEKRGRAFVFRAAESREEHLGRQLDGLANRICEGETTPLVMALVERSEFSPEEIRRFRRLLGRLERKER